jgi:hypothetical protein
MITIVNDASTLDLSSVPRTLVVIHSAYCHWCKDLLAELNHEVVPLPVMLIESQVFKKYKGTLPLSTDEGVPQLYVVAQGKIIKDHTGYLEFAALVDWLG